VNEKEILPDGDEILEVEVIGELEYTSGDNIFESDEEEIVILGLDEPPPPLEDDFEEKEHEDNEEVEAERWNPAALTKATKSLSTWASKWGLGKDPYVNGLQEAMSDSKNMTMWASLDPYERLPVAESKQGALLGSIAEGLAFLRNVLVFVPVAITWWAIGKTTEQFGIHNASKLEVGDKTNFLDFWQNGYGQLDDIKLFGFLGVKIHEVALIDFGIIATIVLLTFVSSILMVWSIRKGERDEKNAEFERESLALILTDALEAKRSASPETIAGSIADVLNDLVDASREVRGAATQLADASQGVGGFHDSIEQLNARIEYLSQQVSLHISSGVVQAINDLGESVNSLNGAVSNDTSRLMDEVMKGLDDVRDMLHRTSSSVEFGAEQLRETLNDIDKRFGGGSSRQP
jgi:uncharacterized protein YoxC